MPDSDQQPTKSDGGTTIGVWIPESSSLLDDFDHQLGTTDPHYSRSDKIKHAMQMYLTVSETLDSLNYKFDAEPSKRHFVQQSIFTQHQHEQQNE